jgi:hypothetical protein
VSSAISIGNENNIMTIHKQTRTHSLCPEKDAGYLKGKKEKEKENNEQETREKQNVRREEEVESYEMLKGKRREMQEQKKKMMIEEIKKGEKKDMQENAGSDAPIGLKKKQPPILSCSFFDVFLMFLLLVLFPTHTSPHSRPVRSSW